MAAARQQVINQPQQVHIGGTHYTTVNAGAPSVPERKRRWTTVTADEARDKLDLPKNGIHLPSKCRTPVVGGRSRKINVYLRTSTNQACGRKQRHEYVHFTVSDPMDRVTDEVIVDLAEQLGSDTKYLAKCLCKQIIQTHVLVNKMLKVRQDR